MSVQMAYVTNLCTEESWAVRTRMVEAVADVAVPFLSFLHSSVAEFFSGFKLLLHTHTHKDLS